MRKTKELNSKHKNLNENKGITLIALVITIIVMLILVAVTISMAINGGLFEYAGKAVSETQNAIDKEQGLADGKIKVGDKWYASIDAYIAGTPIEQGIVLSAETLKLEVDADYNVETSTPVTGEITASLNEIEGTLNWTIDNESVATINVTDGKAVVTAVAAGTAKITVSCTFEGETYTEECIVTVEEPKITSSEVYNDLTTYLGARVDYNIADTSTYSGEWEIFYADEDHIYLITEGYLASGSLTITEYNGTGDFTAENLQSKYPAVAAGLFNKTYDPTAAGTEENPYLKYSSNYFNMTATQYLLDSTVWATYKNDYADWAIGGPTYELFVKSYNKLYPEKAVTLETPTGYGYANPLSATNSVPTGTYLNPSSSNYYWLACPADSMYYVRIVGGGSALVSRGNFGSSNAFRPVVCLKTNVKLTIDSTNSQYTLSWDSE